MQTSIVFIGLCGLVVFAGVAAVAVYAYANRHPDQVRGIKAWLAGYRASPTAMSMPEEPLSRPLATDALPASARADDRLRAVAAKQTVTLLGDRERQVLASLVLTQMWQRTGSTAWTPNPSRRPATAVRLAGDIWLMKVPIREKGPLRWFKARKIDGPSLQMFYLKGMTGQGEGPARKFRNSDQVTPVPYVFPESLGLVGLPGTSWSVEDIGAFKAKVDGKTEEIEDGDLLFHVISSQPGGIHWLVYLDARDNFANGTGGLFLCEEFEPDTEVQAML